MKPRNFVAIGLGAFGGTVAVELARLGDHVLGIDKDEKSVNRLASTLSEALIADCRDEEALREAGVGSYDTALVSIGEDFESNILCVMNLRLLGVKTIWSKALNKTQHRILTKLGVDRVVLPEQEMGQHIAQMLHNPLVRDYVSLGNGYFVVQIGVPPSYDGQPLGDFRLSQKHNIRCLGMMRACDYVEGASDDVVVRSGDQLLLLGQRADLRQFGDSL